MHCFRASFNGRLDYRIPVRVRLRRRLKRESRSSGSTDGPNGCDATADGLGETAVQTAATSVDDWGRSGSIRPGR